MNILHLTKQDAEGGYVLPPLPYAPEALEPHLDAATVSLHHDKHHAAYVAGANAASDELRRIACGELPADQASSAMQKLSFNLGGHVLHSLYWENLSPTAQHRPTGTLASALLESFGSWEGFERVFRSVTLAVQGSGWGVLGLDPMSSGLMVTGVCRHQDVLVPGFMPLLVCDVWEHAYYLRYQNRRADYLDAFMSLADWAVVEKRFNCYSCHGKSET